MNRELLIQACFPVYLQAICKDPEIAEEISFEEFVDETCFEYEFANEKH